MKLLEFIWLNFKAWPKYEAKEVAIFFIIWLALIAPVIESLNQLLLVVTIALLVMIIIFVSNSVIKYKS